MKGKDKIFNISKDTPGFVAGVLILLVSLNILALYNIFIPKSELKVGMVTDKTIKSPKTVYFKSQIKTKEARDKAGEKIEKVYISDPSASVQQKSKMEEAFKKIDEIKGVTYGEKVSDIANVLNLSLSQETSSYIASLSGDDWQKIKNNVSGVLDDIQRSDKIKNDEKFPQESIDKKVSKDLSEKDASVIKELAGALLIPNENYSKEDTDKKVEEKKSDVEPVSLLIAKDEVVVVAGKVIDGLDLEKLEAVGLKSADFLNPKTIGTIIITTLLVLVIISYFRFSYIPSVSIPVNNLKALFIFMLLFLATVVAFQILTPLKPIMAYVIPVAAPILLISILISSDVAVFSAIIFSVFLGIISYNSLELTSVYLITSLAGIYSLRSVEKIEDIFRIGFYLAIASFLVATSFHFIAGSFSIRTISVLLGASSIYGLGTVVLIIGTLLFWGHLFRITTLLDLMELENPSQGLLKNLSIKAPGTYHHSILVSNLAEKAAERIKANSLLVRVGALYHDIGKTANPSYFIENQKKYNIHDKLKNPEKSAEIIKGHVDIGIETAKKEKLPKEILHFIESHHGRSEVFYFLSKAREEKIKIDLSKFSYSGLLPRTKEAAILMLADSVEAKSRAVTSLSSDGIKELVFQIVENKVRGGQLKDSDLSLREIEMIKESFINTLRAMYHKRVEYPREKKK